MPISRIGIGLGGGGFPALSVSPTSAALKTAGTQTFTPSGGTGGYSYSFVTNNSGGTFVAGAYTAGNVGAVTDTLRVTSGGQHVDITVTVADQVPGDFPAKLWLDAALGVTGSSPVTAWANQIGGGGVNAFTSASGITTATGVNGKPSLHFAGAGTFTNTSAISTIVAASAWSALVIFNSGSGNAAANAHFYNEACFIGDFDGGAGGFWGITLNNTQMRGGQSTPTDAADAVSISNNTNHYAIIKYDGSKIFISLDGGAFDAGTAVANISNLTHTLRIGISASQSVHLFGDINTIVVSDQTWNAGQSARVNSYAKNHAGL